MRYRRYEERSTTISTRLTPFEWQEIDIQRIQEAGYTALVNAAPGAGKTVIAIEAALRSDAEVILIIAPLSTHDSAWKRTVEGQTEGQQTVRKIGAGTKAERAALEDMLSQKPGWYITTPQWFTRADITDWQLDMTIADEVHALGNAGKKGSVQLVGTTSGDQSKSLTVRSKYRLALSGTPARNKFERMWTICRFLWPDRLDIARPSYYTWLTQHMLHARVFTGLHPKTRKPQYAKIWKRERNPGNLFSRMPCVIQHFRREQCCRFHPEGFLKWDEPQVLEHVVPLSIKQKKAIRELEEQYLTWLDDNPLVVEIPLTVQQRVRQMCLGVPEFDADDRLVFAPDCESPFADELESILEKLDDNEPVIVYMESQRFAAALTERLNRNGWSAFEFSGATTKTRSKNLQTFGREGGHQIMVAVLSSVAQGTDGLQSVASTEVWLETSTDQVMNEQAEARLDRTGAKAQVQRYYVRDSLGYAAGRFSKQVTAAMELRKSLRVEVKND